VRIFPCVLRDSRDGAFLPLIPATSRIASDPLVRNRGFLLHPVSRSETRRRLKQLHANLANRSARSGKQAPNSLGERVDLEEATAIDTLEFYRSERSKGEV